MNEKGCVFELSTEFKSWEDFIYMLTGDGISKDLLPRVAKQVLGASVEYALDVKLANSFRQNLDLTDLAIAIIREASSEPLDKAAVKKADSFIYEMGRDMVGRLEEMFHDVDMKYALWNTRALSKSVTLVEYKGDFRVMEWHEQNGISCDQNTEVTYEFSIDFLYSQLGALLSPYCGKYAGKYFNKCLDILVRNIVEETVFINWNNVDLNETTTTNQYQSHLVLSDFNLTRREFENYFPLMLDGDVSAVLSAVETTIKDELLVIIRAAMTFSDIRNWFINSKTLTIVVDRPATTIDFVERLKDDIKTSIANGDWVSPKLRALSEL